MQFMACAPNPTVFWNNILCDVDFASYVQTALISNSLMGAEF